MATPRFKFHRKDNTITFFWGAMVRVIKVPEGNLEINHLKGSMMLTSNNVEGYAYDPVFVGDSKEKVEF